MAKKRNAAQHEQYLNELYTDTYSEEEAVEHFDYLTVQDREKGYKRSTTETNIRNCYRKRTLGALVRRLDSVAFNSGKED